VKSFELEGTEIVDGRAAMDPVVGIPFVVSSIEYDGDTKLTVPEPRTVTTAVRHMNVKAAVRAAVV